MSEAMCTAKAGCAANLSEVVNGLGLALTWGAKGALDEVVG